MGGASTGGGPPVTSRDPLNADDGSPFVLAPHRRLRPGRQPAAPSARRRVMTVWT